MSESKAERFQRLMPKRLENAQEALRILGNLSARGNYEYTESQVSEMFGALHQQIAELESQFGAKRSEPDTKDSPFQSETPWTPGIDATAFQAAEAAPDLRAAILAYLTTLGPSFDMDEIPRFLREEWEK